MAEDFEFSNALELGEPTEYALFGDFSSDEEEAWKKTVSCKQILFFVHSKKLFFMIFSRRHRALKNWKNDIFAEISMFEVS